MSKQDKSSKSPAKEAVKRAGRGRPQNLNRIKWIEAQHKAGKSRMEISLKLAEREGMREITARRYVDRYTPAPAGKASKLEKAKVSAKQLQKVVAKSVRSAKSVRGKGAREEEDFDTQIESKSFDDFESDDE